MTLSGLPKLFVTVAALCAVSLGSACFSGEVERSYTPVASALPSIGAAAPDAARAPVSGVNTNFFEPRGVFGNEGVWNAAEAANVPMMRFPGGTRSNFYDWETGRIEDPGGLEPGLAESGIVPMDAFMARARGAGSPVSYVVNITDPPEKTERLARRWRQTNAPVRWVELGNEHYLPDYIDDIGGPTGYFEKARRALGALRAGGYDGPAGLVVAPEIDVGQGGTPDKESRAWNRALAKEENAAFDAVVVHVYPSLDNVDFATVYARSPAALSLEVGNLRRMFPGKQVWVTEWNLGKPASIPQTNTLWNALFDLRMIKAMFKEGVELGCYHVLTGRGWELVHVSDSAGPGSSAVEREVPYFAFQMANEARGEGAVYDAAPGARIRLPGGAEHMVFRTKEQLRVLAWTPTAREGTVRVEADGRPLEFVGGKKLRGDLNATNESPFPEEEIKAVPAESPRLDGPGAVMLRFSLGAGRGETPDEG